MFSLRIHLFGKFSVEYNGEALRGPGSPKVQELLSYLLIHRNRPRPREALAALLWGDISTDKSKKYLRQALWHLQTALRPHNPAEADQLLLVEDQWVQLNTSSEIWLDVAILEEAFVALKDKPGWRMDAKEKDVAQAAVQVYQGELLEGSYQDWCLFERERLQNMHLAMLYKLMSYCEAAKEYEAGQLYGLRILNYDRASERTHRRLMRLQYMSGDRTSALRQYERCVVALDQDLGVKPDKRTIGLYQQIRSGEVEGASSMAIAPWASTKAPTSELTEIADHLGELQRNLSNLLLQVCQDIKDIELALKNRR
ncbi:MAG: BTAD domain-containing putative transcriptional regulator [Pyrinomonadaceae bacterium]